jgi:drug/metabolite transporter (DMT)-like permease
MDPRSRARLPILAAAALFATGGVAIKACGLTGWQIAGFRSLLGAVALALMLPSARRGWTGRTLWVGLAYASTLILYVQANTLTTAANAIFLQSTAPLYLLLLSPLLLREPIRPGELVFMGAMALGLGLFFLGQDPPQRTAPNPALGNVLAAAAGITWALTIAGLRWLGRSEPGGSVPGAAAGAAPGAAGAAGPAGAAASAALLGNALAFLACVPFLGALGETLTMTATTATAATAATVTDWLWIAYLGVFQIGLAYVFLTIGVRRVPALEVSLLLLVEPVLNAILAWAVHGEVPGPWSRAGCAVILTATAVHSALAMRRTRA